MASILFDEDSSVREVFFHVGIRYEYASELQSIEAEMSWGPTQYVNYLKELIKKNMTKLADKPNQSYIADEYLYKLGFTRARARLLKKWIEEDAYSSHQTLLYFASIYIENRLLHIPSSVCKKVKPLFHMPASDDNTLVLFHSTTASSARDITADGIRTNIGEPCQDFSHNGGFYLSDNLEYAIKWAELRSFSSDPAILVYTFPRKLFAFFKGLHLFRECLTDMSLWKKIIQYNHSGREEQNDKTDSLYIPDNKVKYQKHVDYILGPVSLYGGASMFSNVNQFCILTQHFADALSIENNKYLYQIYEWGKCA